MKYSILKTLVVLSMTSLWVIIEAVYCPPYCRCSMANSLRHVKCINRNLISLDLDIPNTVQWLELSHNFISELSDYIFQDLGLENIAFLDLNHNAINSIALNAFIGLEKIHFIDLSGNHLYRINPSTFEHNPLLQHLILSNNPLSNIPAQKPFLISNSLKTLEISHCRLSYFPPDSFQALPLLQYLNISNNDILLLNNNILNDLNNLTELDISNTAIKCDTESTHLLSWAASKSTKIIGSPCSFNKLNNQNINGLKKFEKIIMIDDKSNNYNSEEYNDNKDYETKCLCSDENSASREELIQITTLKPIIDKTRKTLSHDYHSMLWLAFLNGLVTGAALSTSAILAWLYCCKCRRRRRSNRIVQQIEAQYANEHCETPPPAYNELF